MDSPQNDRIEELFVEALGLPEDEREQFLEAACTGDHDLQHKVRVLLDAESRCAEYFDKLPERLGVASLWSSAAPRAHAAAAPVGAVGEHYGQYTLTEFIGSGGMGSVWRAVRSDGRFEGEVAVKLLSRTADSADTERFALEGRYLAKLTHPNIARLIDAGVGVGEQPYLILEYVNGLTLDKHCDAHSLSVRERVELFIEVLDAVAHAHAHLIVHRDIKPSNVRVSTDGSIKLLDFGIAKLLDPRAPHADGLTRQLGVALTPEYAAPEQLEGHPITTATDIYSLGLLLWLLIVGTNPRDTRTARSLAELRELANREPTTLVDAASANGSPEQLRALAERRGTNPAELLKTLRSDLDSIVRKAVAIDPSDRYATAADFAQDLRRYLANEPVTSQINTLRYRMRKFVQRHRGGVATAILTLMAIIGAGAIAVWQSIDAQQQRDLALYQQQRTAGTNEFLQVLLSDLGPSGQPLTPVELLDRGVKLLDQQFGSDDRFAARVSYDLSILYATVGRVDQQIALLDRSASLAHQIEDWDLAALSLCARARAELMTDPERARTDFQRGRSALERVRASSPEARQECYRAEAQLLETDGNREGAVRAISTALEELDGATFASGAQRAVLLNDLSEQYLKLGRVREALSMNAELLETLDRIGRGGTVAKVIYLLNRAAILSRAGEVAVAARAQEQALERIAKLEETGPMLIGARGHYANSLYRLARYEEALALFSAGREAAIASNNTRWIAQHDLMIGCTLGRMDRYDDAERHLSAAEAVYRKTPGANERLLDSIALMRAEMALRSGNIDAAREQIVPVLARLEYPRRKDAVGLFSGLWLAAEVSLAENNWQAAAQFASDAIDAASRSARETRLSADVGQALLIRAQARRALRNETGALADATAALTSLSNGFGSTHPETLRARALLQQ